MMRPAPAIALSASISRVARALAGPACLLPLGTTLACGDAAAPGVTVTDSAGVRVVVSADVDVVYGELDPVPVLSLGGPQASGPSQFFRIQGIHVDPRGRLWVADGQSGELRIFGPDGLHWKTRGGRGPGPGEFVQIRLLGSGPGDTVLVGDGGTDRVSIFSPEGELVRTERLPSSARPAPRPFDVFDDGSILGQLPRVVSAGSIEPGQVLTDSVELVRVTPGTSAPQRYGAAEGPLWLWTGRSQVPVPFTVNASFDVAGAEVYLVSGPSFMIRVLESGDLDEVYAIDRAPRSVESGDMQSYRSFVEAYVPEEMRADHLSALEHPLRPKVLPAYDRVLVSAGGEVWAQVYEADVEASHEWDVFDVDGRFLGQVHVSSGMYPLAITGDAVVGIWRNALGVEHVRAYRFVRA